VRGLRYVGQAFSERRDQVAELVTADAGEHGVVVVEEGLDLSLELF
jgi:hypothetical protein